MDRRGVQEASTSFDIASSFVSKYVRNLALDGDRFSKVVTELGRGTAFTETEFMAVAMIDIAGYSKFTSALTDMGKISSEILTETVGKFLNDIINVVNHHDGDILKFLGDALLVTFTSSTKSNAFERPETIAERAIMCCSQILQKHGSFTINCDGFGANAGLPTSNSQNPESEYLSNLTAIPDSKTTTQINEKLRLHIAITGGDLEHVIMGNPNERLDYSVYGSCLSSLGHILDHTSPGEIGIDLALWNLLSYQQSEYGRRLGSLFKVEPIAHTFARLNLESVNILTSNISRKMSVAPPDKVPQLLPAEETTMRMLSKFINQSMTWKLLAIKNVAGEKGEIKNKEGSAWLNYPQNHDTRRGTLTSVKSTGLGVFNQWNNLIAGEFRTLSIVFVKLHKTFDPRVSQLALSAFLTSLRKYEGVFQQYSVDDKGQTLMASEPKYAVPAMLDFLIFASKNGITPISIGIATGELLFAVIGNTSRCEVSLLGDTVNIAARLMGLELEQDVILCDENTHLGADDLNAHMDLGLHKLKGKDDLRRIWKILPKAGESAILNEDFFGYQNERDQMLKLFNKWKVSHSKVNIFVEAASGLGKSKLGKMFANHALANEIPVCLTQGSELEQGTPYFGLNFHSRTGGATRSHHPEAEDFLRYHNEDFEMAPLLGLILPELKAHENPKTAKLDQQTKGNLARSLILRIFKSFVSKQKFVFIFDDIQWLDELSLEIILSLVRFSSQECMVFLSRPVKESGSDTLKTIQSHRSVQTFQLKGLDSPAIEQMIIQKLNDSGHAVNKIDDSLVQGICEKGSGFPLYIDVMGDALREKINKDFIIDSSGCLKIADITKSANDVLIDNVGTAVISHFDKLNSDFQETLRVASCFGQYFNLRDICELSRLRLSIMETKELIEKNDVYNFIQIDSTPVTTMESESSTTIDAIDYQCSFRHISIMNAIYDSLSFATRSTINQLAAERFESLLSETNIEVILPWVCYYYSRSQNKSKAIQYLELLGYEYIQKSTYAEANKTFAKLFEIVENERIKGTIEPLRRGTWLSSYAYALVMRRKVDECVPFALEAINLVHQVPWPSWPQDQKGLKKRFVKTLVKFVGLWFKTRGGKKSLHRDRDGRKISSDQEQQLSTSILMTRDGILEQSMTSIFIASVYSTNDLSTIAAIALMELLCMNITRAYRDLSGWKLILARSAFAFLNGLVPLARFLYKALCEVDGKGEATQIHHLVFATSMIFIGPKISVSAELFESASRYFAERGETISYNMAVAQTATIRFNLGQTGPNITQLATDPNILDIFTGSALYTIAKKLTSTNELTEALEYLEKLRLFTFHVWKTSSSLTLLNHIEWPLQLLRGDYRNALNSLREAQNQFRQVARLQVPPMDAASSASLFIWLWFSPPPQNHTDRVLIIQDRAVEIELRKELIIVLTEGRVKSKKK
ncbi:hypothetical protein HDU76_013670 [Blyttiomyces sp. JEL0837]|nr:hypothetical protein HDU76_013670 [Blyttiomyces sp. JEL0837]